ncbi:MAG: redoxin domain-containing protein, partial [Anaerolineae bacterium]
MQLSRRRALYVLILLVGAAWIVASADRAGTSTAGRIPAPQKGFLAPDFTLSDPQGKSYTLSHLRGQAVVVNIWATWCPPCKEEMPALEAAYHQYQAQGL